MDIEHMRKDFEARFPVPDGVVFDLVANNYCADFWTSVDLKDFYTHQARWESWQAAKEQAVPEGWQPIETAPKNGTRIMLSGFRDYETVIGFWNDYHAPGHWCFSAETVLRNTDVPTHWMPLPAAPEAK